MKYTLTFTEEHEQELRKIAEMDVFAAKIARTILSSDVYKASPKQVEILNQVSDVYFYISNDYSFKIEQENRERMMQNLPSSMR